MIEISEMFKSIVWEKPIPLSEVEHIRLPKSFSFISEFRDGVLYAIGITSTFVGIGWHEIQMVNEGFA